MMTLIALLMKSNLHYSYTFQVMVHAPVNNCSRPEMEAYYNSEFALSYPLHGIEE